MKFYQFSKIFLKTLMKKNVGFLNMSYLAVQFESYIMANFLNFD